MVGFVGEEEEEFGGCVKKDAIAVVKVGCDEHVDQGFGSSE